MREPPHRHAGAQHEQAHLRQYHPCNRERIHTSSNDRCQGALVTILGVEALMPSACHGKAPSRRAFSRKIVTGQRDRRSLPAEAKNTSRKQNETNYEKKHINARSRGCDSAWRLCCCAGTTWPWWARGLARARIRPSASRREIGPDP